MIDLDKGGFPVHKVRSYLGPSLGWVDTLIKPPTWIVEKGTYTLPAGTGVVLVNVMAKTKIILPPVHEWVEQIAYQPATAFERAIWIKDLGGHSKTFPIMVHAFKHDRIDNLHDPFIIDRARCLIKLYPLFDLSGWFTG